MPKKISKILTSRLFYLFLGLFLAITIFVAKAAWNTRVSPGEMLTATQWNDLVAHIEELENRINTLQGTGGTATGSGHPATAVTGTPSFSTTLHTAGNGPQARGPVSGWTSVINEGSFESLPGQYICGIDFMNNCDHYSSQDACISIKACSD